MIFLCTQVLRLGIVSACGWSVKPSNMPYRRTRDTYDAALTQNSIFANNEIHKSLRERLPFCMFMIPSAQLEIDLFDSVICRGYTDTQLTL